MDSARSTSPAGTATAVLRAHALCKTYGSGETAVRALRDVDLEIARGEFVVLLGASGSGKSTLLNILGGLDVPTSGEVFFEEHALHGASDDALTTYRREHVGFVFQFYNLIPSLTVAENVALVTDIARDRCRSTRRWRWWGWRRGAITSRRSSPAASSRGGHRPRDRQAAQLLLCDEPRARSTTRRASWCWR